MTEDPRPTRPSVPGGPMSERMQALLSRAAEEQLTEQRQVSAVLAELRGLVANLGEQLRGTASSARLESLGGDVSSLLTELRTSTSAVGERLDVLARRVDEQATSAGELVSAQSTSLDRLTDAVGALSARMEGVATGDEVTASRDALVAAMTGRLDRIEGLVDRLGGLDVRLSALEARLGEVAERLSDVSDAAGGVPAVATDLSRMAGRLDEVAALRADVLATREAVRAQQEDSPVPSLVLGVAALREDVEGLGARVGEVTVPTTEDVATAVGQQVTDRLVEELAPRVADVVLTRVAATLVEQVSGSVAADVQDGLTEKVRAAAADSERRISAHVDEAVLALAEALLRRRRGSLGTAALLATGDLEAAAPVDLAPGAAGPAADVEPDDAVSAGPPAEVPVVPTSTLPERTEPSAAASTQSVVAAPQWGDDEDGSPRRAWWRPGG